MPSYKEIGMIILAGGKSSRMGEDKGLMIYQNQPMIAHVLSTAQKINRDIILIANRDEYKTFGFPVFKDAQPGLGPMEGIKTGLENSKSDYNFILSCDIPHLHEGVLEFLADSCTGYDITVSQQNGKLHPLVGIYRKSCLPVIHQKMEQGDLKVRSLFDSLKVRQVDMEDFLPENFRNINSPEDL